MGGVGVLEGGGKWVVDWWLWVVGMEDEEGGVGGLGGGCGGGWGGGSG